MDQSFESRVWARALAKGLISTDQVNRCLKDAGSAEPTLQLTEILVRKGILAPDQVATLRSEVTQSDPAAPEEVLKASRDPRNLIGRYIRLSELGHGGMGAVYKAWDGDLRRFVAVKVLSGPGTAEDIARFKREAQSAAALKHPNIVTVYEIGATDETPFIAMELVEGRTLDGRRLPARKATQLMVLIARAVHAAHERGIIHRDLKPHNIMVDDQGGLRVMDFGLAKPVESSSQITMSGTILGTPAYMAPEQAQGRVAEIGARSDIFSLGALLYELITGQAPFKGGTPLETLTAVVHHRPVSPRKLDPSVPRPLEAIILTCLQKDRMKRYATAEGLAQDLERFLRGVPIAARLPYRPERLAFGAAAVLALAAGSLVLWKSEPVPPPPPKIFPAPPPPAPVDRAALDRGLRLLEQARLDFYRGSANLTRTRSTLEEAEREFGEALKVDPKSGAAYLGRGEARSRLNQTEEALADLAEAIRLLPTSPAAALARGHVLLERFMDEMGSAAWMKGDLPEEILRWRNGAREDFVLARQRGAPRNELPYLDACLAFSEERYREAIDLLTRTLPEAERAEEFHKLRGDAYAALAADERLPAPKADLRRQSLDDYNQALRLRSGFPAALRARGALLWGLGRPEDALADFQAFLALDPRDSRALSDIGTYYQRKGQPDVAKDHFDRALALDARNFRALANRAVLHMERQRYDEARLDLEAALKANPRHLPALYNLAVTHYKLKNRTEALKRLEDLIVRAPQFARARASRGVIYTDDQRWKEALEDFEKALQIEPGLAPEVRPYVEECRRRLGR